MPHLHCVIVMADDKNVFSSCVSFAVKIRQFWWKKFINLVKDNIEPDKILMKETYTSCCSM